MQKQHEIPVNPTLKMKPIYPNIYYNHTFYFYKPCDSNKKVKYELCLVRASIGANSLPVYTLLSFALSSSKTYSL